MLQVLFLTQGGETLPSVRFRVLPYVRLGREKGLRIEQRQIPKRFLDRLLWYLRLPQAGNIILQKKLVAPWELRLLWRKCGRLVYDFDDAVWTCHPNVPAGERRTRKEARYAARLEKVARASDLVIAGNTFLADKVRPWAERVDVLPTPLDTDAYTPPETRPEGVPVTVGWVGTGCNQFFLPGILPDVLTELERLVPKGRFVVVSDSAYQGPGAEAVTFERWSAIEEAAQLRALDIGLMPLSDDEYTRGKCGFKILQYMACGAVPVASDVGFNREIVIHGETGFLVREPSDWARYVGLLAHDPEMRIRMARAGRARVVEFFSVRSAADKLWHMLGVTFDAAACR